MHVLDFVRPIRTIKKLKNWHNGRFKKTLVIFIRLDKDGDYVSAWMGRNALLVGSSA